MRALWRRCRTWRRWRSTCKRCCLRSPDGCCVLSCLLNQSVRPLPCVSVAPVLQCGHCGAGAGPGGGGGAPAGHGAGGEAAQAGRHASDAHHHVLLGARPTASAGFCALLTACQPACLPVSAHVRMKCSSSCLWTELLLTIWPCCAAVAGTDCSMACCRTCLPACATPPAPS